MDDYKFNEIKDVRWESINPDKGNIKFRNNKSHSRIKKFLKLVAFILIAVISGSISGYYVVDKKINNIENSETYKGNPIISEKTPMKSTDKSSITRVAESVGPAVVGISNKSENFWGEVDKGSGSGIIFKPDGYIVTNYHVIEGASQVTVKLSSGKVFPAKIVGYDKRSDLAVIKIEANNLPTAKFGDSSKVNVGDLAIVIGNPLGEEFAGSVTAGIISALNRRVEHGGAIYKVLQTDAAINPGNSGGALCNENGEVIGINSLKIGATANVEGMGFAISINEAKEIIDSLMNYGKVKRPSLGVMGQTVVSRDGEIRGFYVNEVISGSGAAKSGIKPTDVIIELNGKKVQEFDDIAQILEQHKIGDTVKCKVWRNGTTKEVNIILSELKDLNQ
ncbi:PDZ domain-containing protein [Clostridium cochlearium]|uniref:S1C family serine protease n=1 Tax=Clostridium cochlearium TaxID=1494 RepID=UPI00145928A3|nr:trypsin-like peptidase domain-containing protein [Clostridium cochlearium]MBV1816690.1 trypsin-like peptidase domain-containing protein [Bacteroidales bacterium MSK.15.36]NSJ90525.1 PDZ domain-containing protein [Coprococcus sp. MSK.21.13]MCG4571262.1 trypsin-like peptidase domain-containing protein [Clostridium cochlearium]MCR1972022.1 trypsin-like peptidase domain-containing protein [Clostridium cochlearium]NME95098.1 PDZ domain-containing protein [Clostridium cochlearium]